MTGFLPVAWRPVAWQLSSSSAADYTLTCTAAAAQVLAQAAGLRAARVLTAQPAAVSLAGSATVLLRQVRLQAAPAAVLVAGASATLSRQLRVLGQPGAAAVSGGSVVLSVSGGAAGYALTVQPAPISLQTPAQALTASRRVACSAASAVVAGQQVVMRRGRVLACSPAAALIVGQSAQVLAWRRIACQSAQAALTGRPVVLSYSGALAPAVYARRHLAGLGGPPSSTRPPVTQSTRRPAVLQS